jgi:hypothetical protein
LAGSYVVLVEQAPPPGLPGWEALDAQSAKARSQWLNDGPIKYRSMKTPGLTFEVKPDTRANAFRIDLEP